MVLEAEAAAVSGHNLIILSDRDLPEHLAPVPSLLATSAVNLHLGRLAARCATARRYEFLFTHGTLRIVGGTGCPANPIAVL